MNLAPRRLAGPLLLFALAPSLLAFDYGTPILVRSEGDIIELEYMGEIDEEYRDQLLDLFDSPLDLNTASRDDLYLLPDVTYSMADRIISRRGQGGYASPREIRDIVGRTVWNQVKPFVITMRIPAPAEPLKGTVNLRYLDKFDDDKPPVAYIKTKAKYRKWLELGLLVAEENGVYGVDYTDGNVTIEGMRPVVSLERMYASIDRGTWSVMIGHYKAGFGQRLTFDVTDKQRPHGIYNDLKITEDYEDYDSYSVSRRLMGIAASTERHVLEDSARLELTFFASSNPNDLYYTYITPRDYTVTGDGEVDGDGEVTNPTFPWVYREDIVGLNATLFWSKRTHVGFTGWGGHTWKAYEFDFKNTPLPNREYYGALGLDGAWGEGIVDVLGEVAITDSGGLGARAETVIDPGIFEASIAMRYYGEGFDNPHSRGKSEPDQYGYVEDWEEYSDYAISGGDRDRDEIGPQVQVVFDPLGWLRVRAKGDLWHVPSLDVNHAYAEGRIDIDPVAWGGLDVVAYMRDKDVSQGGREQFYEDPNSSDDEEPKGVKNALGGGFRLQPVEPVIIQCFAKQIWEDSSQYDDTYMNDRYAWGKVIWDITEDVEVAGRAKIYEERIDDDTVGVQYWSAYGQARGRLFDVVTLFARYEQVHDMDSPDEATEHKLKIGTDFKF